MAYEIIWLDEARKSLEAEMEYVFSNFGLLTLSEVYDDLHERVDQLKLFPRIGVRHEDLDYMATKCACCTSRKCRLCMR
ncbi:MAG: hypothetical protein II001_02805 [Bacteroidales bacterium]|nr:hypothetical protein [Bacteroidales bacterium]